eukprot:749497-Hanusia_phi.AAC.7
MAVQAVMLEVAEASNSKSTQRALDMFHEISHLHPKLFQVSATEAQTENHFLNAIRSVLLLERIEIYVSIAACISPSSLNISRQDAIEFIGVALQFSPSHFIAAAKQNVADTEPGAAVSAQFSAPQGKKRSSFPFLSLTWRDQARAWLSRACLLSCADATSLDLCGPAIQGLGSALALVEESEQSLRSFLLCARLLHTIPASPTRIECLMSAASIASVWIAIIAAVGGKFRFDKSASDHNNNRELIQLCGERFLSECDMTSFSSQSALKPSSPGSNERQEISNLLS